MASTSPGALRQLNQVSLLWHSMNPGSSRGKARDAAGTYPNQRKLSSSLAKRGDWNTAGPAGGALAGLSPGCFFMHSQTEP